MKKYKVCDECKRGGNGAYCFHESLQERANEQVAQLGCDGMCEPMCTYCNRMADQAADNIVIERGY